MVKSWHLPVIRPPSINKNKAEALSNLLTQTEKILCRFLDYSRLIRNFASSNQINKTTMEVKKQFGGPLNEAQMSVLQMLGRMKSVEEVEELRKVISDYYARKVDEGMDRLWESGEWSNDRIDEILNEDIHAE